MPNTYTELRQTVLGTTTPSVTFDLTGISGYTDLIVVISARGNNAGTGDQVKLQVNADTGNNYSRTILYGTGSAAASARTSSTNSILIDYVAGNTAAAGTFGLCTINLMNYSNSTTFKTILSRAGTAGDLVEANVGLWRNTAAITSIIISPGIGTNWLTGSTFSLYGIANADQGAAKATGGMITEDSQYWYHTFGATGAFIPKQSLTCDVLVVAGGGASSFNYAGGGGAGGLLAFTSQSLTAISYNVTVGAGGSAGTSIGVRGTNGNDSQFGALTLVKGGGAGGASEGSSQRTGLTGGSGGGGGGADTNQSYTGTNAGGSPTTSQGFAGGAGRGISGSGSVGGGGGGAGAAGQDAPSSPFSAGSGGVGTSTYSSWGLVTGTGQNVSGTVYYAGGGGGGAYGGPAVGAAGLGGGGVGVLGTVGTAGIANTGGGAGGSGSGSAGGAGGSGVVIVRYAK
jgi:hypothetical protein